MAEEIEKLEQKFKLRIKVDKTENGRDEKNESEGTLIKISSKWGRESLHSFRRSQKQNINQARGSLKNNKSRVNFHSA